VSEIKSIGDYKIKLYFVTLDFCFSGDPAVLSLWKRFKDLSIEEYSRMYDVSIPDLL